MPFDPIKDLTPIATLVDYTNVLVVNKDAPVRTMRELITYAKVNPNKVTYGSAGIGASNHLSGELLQQRIGAPLTHVPYRGSALAMADVVSGQIMAMFDIVSTARNYVNAGQVRPLAITSKDRNAGMPNVPTMMESGVADYDVSGWFGVFGPPKMAAADATRYGDAFRRVLNTPEVKTKLVDGGYDLWLGTPQDLSTRLAKELALWAPIAKSLPKQ